MPQATLMYMCDPAKNEQCRKSSCFLRTDDPGPCRQTHKQECASSPTPLLTHPVRGEVVAWKQVPLIKDKLEARYLQALIVLLNANWLCRDKDGALSVYTNVDAPQEVGDRWVSESHIRIPINEFLFESLPPMTCVRIGDLDYSSIIQERMVTICQSKIRS